MNIDIEKEREWWDGASESTERAHSYLDELEATQRKLEDEWINAEAQSAVVDALGLQVNELRTQLTDQRARDIRMMGFVLMNFSVLAGDSLAKDEFFAAATEAYDLLAATPVPPPSEVERG